MNHPACAREADVLRAVAREWRAQADAEVRAHVSACARCSEVRAAAEHVRAAWVRDAQAAHVPPGAAMWWRLERRLRAERARQALRLAGAVQAVVLAAALGAAAAVMQIASPWLEGSGGLVSAAWQSTLVALTTWSQAAAAWAVPIALIIATWLLLVPAAVYLGLRDE